MYFSVGILYSSQEFLGFLRNTPGVGINFSNILPFFNLASTKAVVDVSQRCGWIQLNLEGYFFITEKGKEVLDSKNVEVALRIQLAHLIDHFRPTWLPLLSKGRSVAARYLPVDVVQCFREAELLISTSDEVVNWWDDISKIHRKISKDEKLEVGRKGEKLSIDHERKRTKREPYWQALESNLAGFDILSTISEENSKPLNIEVKTANSQWDEGTFHVTENEWRIATISENYIFHLWSLLPKPKLFVIETSKVAEHIPNNRGEGVWKSVEIAFSSVVSTNIQQNKK